MAISLPDHAPTLSTAPERIARALVALLVLALVMAMVRLAWLGDDAFITFRSVDNLLHGFGPRWNVDERVQTFTHPLWFWLLCGVQALTGELQLSTIWFGIALSLAAVLWLLRLCPGDGARLVLLLCLLCSRGWLDYTTSGLENPLIYLLLAALLASLRVASPARRAFAVWIATGWLGCTRLDLLALALPVGAAVLVAVPWRTALRAVAVGMLPLAAWSLFATVYYGSPFPITAYAKAFAVGVPAGELFAKGLYYLRAHLVEDPGMVAVIGLGLVAGWARRGTRMLACGMLLHLAYVLKVGGDYMLGRFLTPIATVAVLLLATEAARLGRRALVATVLVVAGAAATHGLPGYLRTIEHDLQQSLQLRADGLSDERTYYFAFSGLLAPNRHLMQFGAGFHSTALRQAGDTGRRFEVIGSVGLAGYVDGDLVHVVDPWLLDPFLMRLPVGDLHDWRVGHYYRRIPAGYLESLASGENRIEHPRLANVYDAVRSVTRDPIWSAERWRQLWRLLTGGFDADLEAYVREAYRQPPRLQLPLAEFLGPLEPGTPWFRHAAARSCANGGLAVRLPAPVALRAVQLYLSPAERYHVELCAAGAVVHAVDLQVPGQVMDGMRPQRIELALGAAAIDEIRLSCPAPVAAPLAPFLGRVELERP